MANFFFRDGKRTLLGYVYTTDSWQITVHDCVTNQQLECVPFNRYADAATELHNRKNENREAA